jgi:hypothetical protein
MTHEPGPHGWPDEGPDAVAVQGPGLGKLVVLYGLPLVIMFFAPAVAWVGLFPGAVGLRWTTQPPHRRRLVALYVVVGLISFAPWIAWVFGGDTTELSR